MNSQGQNAECPGLFCRSCGQGRTAVYAPLSEGLEDVVDILSSRAGPDAVVNQAAVAVIERVDRTRGAPQDVVDQFDIRQFG